MKNIFTNTLAVIFFSTFCNQAISAPILTACTDQNIQGTCVDFNNSNFLLTSNLNKKISSIKLKSDYRITICDENHFKGHCVTVHGKGVSPINLKDIKGYFMDDPLHPFTMDFDDKVVSFELAPIDNLPPTNFRHIVSYPANNAMGNAINADGVQGIAHSSTNWYLTTTWRALDIDIYYDNIGYDIREKSHIYKTLGDDWFRPIKRVPIHPTLWDKGYHHLGDPDFYDGYLYIPLEKGKDHVPGGYLPTAIAIYDENLHLLGHAEATLKNEAGELVSSSGGWVAINKTNGLLYLSRGAGNSDISSSPYTIIDAYKRDISKNPDGTLKFNLIYTYSFKVNFSDSWNKRTYTQGGVFSDINKFYYMMDPAKLDNEHSQAGVHGFNVFGRKATEMSILGRDNENQGNDFMHINSDGFWELEGLDYVTPGEKIYIDLIKKQKGIDITTLDSNPGKTVGYVIAIHLHNDYTGEDNVKGYHYRLFNGKE